MSVRHWIQKKRKEPGFVETDDEYVGYYEVISGPVKDFPQLWKSGL